MLTFPFAKLLPLSSETPQVDQKVEIPDAPSFDVPAVDDLIKNQPPIFGPDDPTPEFRLHREVSDEPVMKASFSEAELERESPAKDVATASPQLDTSGEAVSDVSSATAVVLASEQSDPPAASGSFFSSLWPYVLMGVIVVGWVVTQMRLKRAPSFKHHVIPERTPEDLAPESKGFFKASTRFKSNEDGQESNTEIVHKAEPVAVEKIAEPVVVPAPTESSESIESQPKKTGQFKVATRFQKPKQTEEQASKVNEAIEDAATTARSDKSSTLAGPHFKQETGKNMDRPADDEFELEFGESDSDSEVLSDEERAKILEAAEIIAAMKKRKNLKAGSRFK